MLSAGRVTREGLGLWPDAQDGKQPLHNVLERHTWHPAQHVRQVMMLLRDNGIEPAGPLSDADLAGLPMPHKVWDDEVSAP